MNAGFICPIVLAGILVGNFISARSQTETEPGGATVMLPGSATTRTVGGIPGLQSLIGDAGVTPGVNGAPFSLEGSIETAQTLSDGNRIVHRQTVHLYRDSKGRARREETLAAVGPWAASGPVLTMITIQDPVAGASYFFDSQHKVATKLPSVPNGKNVMVSGRAGSEPANIMVTGSAGSELATASMPIAGFFLGSESGSSIVGFTAGSRNQRLPSEDKSLSLGNEMIAGLSADGTRTVTTIPANAAGNQYPLDIVRERWYSPDLQIVLRSKQEDPRFAEITYEVTRLDRSEPAASLFEVPSDYKINKGEARVFVRHEADSQ